MTHLETVLRRAVADLDPSDREGRRRAFGDVRAQMMRLLAVYEPPLSADEIEGKIDELDTIIRRLEAEYAPPSAAEPPAPEPAAPVPSDFSDEYEAGEEDVVLDEPDEGPFDLEDGEVLDGEEPVEEAPPATRGSVIARIAAVGLALVIIAAGAGFLVYLASEPSRQQTAEAPQATSPEPQASEPVTPADTAPPQSPTPEPSAPPAASEPATAVAPAPVETPTSVAPPEPTPTDATAPAPSTAPASPPSTTPAPLPSGPVAESLILFDGSDPGMFRSTADNPVRFDGYPAGGTVRISSSANSNGARLRVGPGVYERIAGRHVRILVVARAAPDDPADALRFAYQNGRRLSPWSDQKLSDDFQTLVLDWTVPAERTGSEGDSLLIEPGIPGDGTAADIRSVTIDVLP